VPEFDLLIRNGLIVTGDRTPAFRADIGVTGGRIAAIGPLPRHSGREVFDADGLVVAPGAVDLHTHFDAQLFWDPYLTPVGWHGATTVVMGNCGYGLAPTRPSARDAAMRSMEAAEQIPQSVTREGVPWNWETFPEYLQSVERAPKALEIAALFPLSPALIEVLGPERAKAGDLPSADEHKRLRHLVREAFDAGAIGVSAHRHPTVKHLQRDYDGSPFPTDVMHDETMLEVGDEVRHQGRGFLQYTQGFSPDFDFIDKLASCAGQPVLWNALGAGPGGEAFGQRLPAAGDALAWLTRSRSRGLRIFGHSGAAHFGQNEFTAVWNVEPHGVGALIAGSPTFEKVLFGGDEESRHKLLGDPAVRAEMRADLSPQLGRLVLFRGASERSRSLEGQRLEDAAAETGSDLVDLFCDVLIADQSRTEFGQRPATELRWLKEVVEDPFTLIGMSDGGAHQTVMASGPPTTSAITGWSRDLGWLSLEEVHWRISGLPSHIAGLYDRGLLSPGRRADIMVYDYEHLTTLPSEVVLDRPGNAWRRVNRAHGYHAVYVGGERIIADDEQTGSTPGSLVRHTGRST
jgi:N-acyl-D-amino-acid deacylase